MIIEVLSGHETRATVLGYIQRGGSPSGARPHTRQPAWARAPWSFCATTSGGLAVGERGNQH